MTAAGKDFEPDLAALFGAEARGHLAYLEAAVAALGPEPGAAPLRSILDALHTLAGAARSVDLLDLEYLCRALERVFGAALDAGAAPASREPVFAALALAPQLFAQPAGRVRNQALALCGQLDALAAQLAQAMPIP